MINAAVEGESDRGAVEALIRHAGHDVGKIVPAGGKSKLDPKIPKYRQAARATNWIVVRDSDGACPVELIRHLAPASAPENPRFSLRIAHGMIEAWLLADREGFAEFFHVSTGRVPTDPESLHHAKQTLLQLCGRSTSRAIARDMVAGDRPGPLYVARLNEFASTLWDVAVASESAPSLARALRALSALP
jgi:hypothetical protein